MPDSPQNGNSFTKTEFSIEPTHSTNQEALNRLNIPETVSTEIHSTKNQQAVLATSNIFCRNYFFYGFLCIFVTCFSEARYELERLLNRTKWLKLFYKWIRMYPTQTMFSQFEVSWTRYQLSQRRSQWSSVASPSVQKNHVVGVPCHRRGRIA